jgi:hypothetical protein
MFPKVKFFMSEEDIESGKAWLRIILENLEKSDMGIICLTPENLSSPWLLFETGAIAKKLSSKAYTLILGDIEKKDIPYPLSIFQSRKFDKIDDFKKLIKDINNALPKQYRQDNVNRLFKPLWNRLNKNFEPIIKNYKKTSVSSDTKIFGPVWSDFKRYISKNYIVLGTETRTTKKIDQQTTIHQAEAMVYLWNTVNRICSSDISISTSENPPKTAGKDNEIIIGGPKNNKRTKEFLRSVKTETGIKIIFCKNKKPKFGSKLLIKSEDNKILYSTHKGIPDYEGKGEFRKILIDVGLIVKQTKKRACSILVAGCHSVGTLGAAKAICFEDILSGEINKSINKISNKGSSVKIFVIKVDSTNGDVQMPEVIYP